MHTNKGVRLRTYYETDFFDFEYSRDYLDDIFTVSRLHAVWKALPKESRGHPWLDVGCGFGYSLKRLNSLNAFPCIGIDLSMRFLKEAERVICRTCNLCQADALALPFNSLAFQGVLALEVIEHTLDVSAAIDEICRVSSDYIFLSFPTDYDWLYERWRIFKNPYIGLSFEEALNKHIGHISVPKLRVVKECLSRNGFEIQALKSLYSILPPPFKLGFHYPDLKRTWRIFYNLIVLLDHWLGRFPPFRGHGLNTVVVARRKSEIRS